MEPDSPTEEVHAPLLQPVSGQCGRCGAPLAKDQRYCVECGERAGDSRVPMPTQPPPVPALAPTKPRGFRPSANATLITGVATLLLAMGIGVLIGRGSNNSPAKPAAAQVITVPTAAAGTAAATTTAASATTASTSGGGHKKSKHAKSSSSSSAAANVLHAKRKLPPATVKVGSKGSGPGYDKKTHKFTGQFFGQ